MIIFVVFFICLFYISYKLKIRPFITLLIASIFLGLFLKINFSETLYLIYKGFYNIVISIGPIIITGTVLGKFLNETGASRKMVNTFISYFGYKKIPLSLGILKLMFGLIFGKKFSSIFINIFGIFIHG